MDRKEKIEVLEKKLEVAERKVELAAKTFAMMSALMREYADTLRNQNNIFNKTIDKQ